MAFDCVLAAWTTHEGELRGYLASRLQDRDTAEDLLQEVFLRAMAQGRRFCELSAPRAWLFRVAHNALVDSTRRRRPSAELSPELMAPEADDGPEPVDAPAECLERALAAPDQHVLRRCDLEHGPQVRQAELHGRGLPAVKARLRRARLFMPLSQPDGESRRGRGPHTGPGTVGGPPSGRCDAGIRLQTLT